MKGRAGLMKEETVKCNNSSVCHSFIISPPTAAVGFHTTLVSAASPLKLKLLSTLTVSFYTDSTRQLGRNTFQSGGKKAVCYEDA